jgi:hypothetical protein
MNKSLLTFICLLLVVPCQAKIIYVDDDANGLNDGSSWANAYNYLQDALADANSSDKPVEIWVPQGIYRPDRNWDEPNGSGDREATFQLINGVTLKGGYAGLGQPDPNNRNIDLYKTILSGDLAGNDVNVNDPCDLLTEPTRAENSHHVVTGCNINKTAVLDGLTVTAGNANGSPDDDCDRGGGMFNNGHDNPCSPTVTGCMFISNSADFSGGGMFNYEHGDGECNPILTNCTFIRNASGMEGGAMSSWGGHSVVTNCTFGGNYSHDVGGGMGNEGSNPTVRNCTFSDNSTNGGGGGMVNYYSSPLVIDSIFRANSADGGGGMYNVGTYSRPTLTNCRFIGNTANNDGGAIYNEYPDTATLTNCSFSGNSAGDGGGGIYNVRSSPMLSNCTFSGNSAQNNGGGLYNLGVSKPGLTNCILWGNNDSGGMDESAQIFGGTPVVTYSCIQGLNAFMGYDNIGDDPLFVDADGADDIPGTVDDNPRLMEGSPCIDNGNNAVIPVGVETDLDGHPRIIDGDCNDTDIVDIGAYEFNYAYMGDFDYNCQVDFGDFAILALAWLTNPKDGQWNPTCDISIPNDSFINMLDLHVFVENWLAGIE